MAKRVRYYDVAYKRQSEKDDTEWNYSGEFSTKRQVNRFIDETIAKCEKSGDPVVEIEITLWGEEEWEDKWPYDFERRCW